MDAVIHNAGVSTGRRSCRQRRRPVPAHRADRPAAAARVPQQRHAPRRASRPHGLDWSGRQGTGSYSDSKLFVTALALPSPGCGRTCQQRRRPGLGAHADGRAGAPDDLRLGHLTQEWLATSDEPEARSSGGLLVPPAPPEPPPATHDPRFQDELLGSLERFTGTPLG